MSKIIWDKESDIVINEGLSRGLIVDPETFITTSWFGLIEVSDNSGFTEPDLRIVWDGSSHGIPPHGGSFSGSISAFTYPTELEKFIGNEEIDGFLRQEGFGKPFIFCFQEMVNGFSLYHIIWDVIAFPSGESYESWGEDPAISDFSWSIFGRNTKSQLDYYPFDHLRIDSRYAQKDLINLIEESIYGEDIYNQRGYILESPDKFVQLSRILTPIS